MYAPVRGGNRGGHDQFEWENVKLMSYKDRECYLGASQTLGYLDKGGKWRRRDWYAQGKDSNKKDQEEARKDKLKAEVELKKAEEKALLNFKLGISDDVIKGCTDVKQVLEAVRNDYIAKKTGTDGKTLAAQQKVSSLTDFEIKELTQKMAVNDPINALNDQKQVMPEEEDPEVILQQADRIKGVGFDKQHILSMTSKAILN